MQRKHIQFIVVITLAVSALAMLHASVVVGARFPEESSAASTQTVRAYVAAVNQFLAGGDLREPTRYLSRSSDSALPRSLVVGSVDGDTEIAALAFRATYPKLQFAVVDISTSGDLVIAKLSVSNADSTIPDWLNDGISPSQRAVVEAFRVRNGLIEEHWASESPALLAHMAPASGVPFWLDRPARMTVSRLTIRPPASGERYVALTGPGFVIPQSGSFKVDGNGLLRIASWESSSSRVIMPGETVRISTSDLLIIPRGNAVLSVSDRGRSDVLFMSAVPLESAPMNDPEMARGFQRASDLEVTLRMPVGSKVTLWFGSLEILAIADRTTEPGWLSMEMGWIILPPDDRATIDDRDGQTALYELNGDHLSIADANASPSLQIENSGTNAVTFAVARAAQITLISGAD